MWWRRRCPVFVLRAQSHHQKQRRQRHGIASGVTWLRCAGTRSLRLELTNGTGKAWCSKHFMLRQAAGHLCIVPRTIERLHTVPLQGLRIWGSMIARGVMRSLTPPLLLCRNSSARIESWTFNLNSTPATMWSRVQNPRTCMETEGGLGSSSHKNSTQVISALF